MPINGDIVEVFNRTSKSLTYQVDGRRFRLAPGPSHILWEHVRYAKNQNPLMGSIDPFDIRSVGFLVGVVGTKDPVSPVEQSDEEELLDRSMYGEGEIVKLKTRHMMTRGSANRKLRQDEKADYRPSEHFPPPGLEEKLPPAQVGLVTSKTVAAKAERKRIGRIWTDEQKQNVRAKALARSAEKHAAEGQPPPNKVVLGSGLRPQIGPTANVETVTVDGKTYDVIKQLDRGSEPVPAQ